MGDKGSFLRQIMVFAGIFGNVFSRVFDVGFGEVFSIGTGDGVFVFLSAFINDSMASAFNMLAISSACFSFCLRI